MMRRMTALLACMIFFWSIVPSEAAKISCVGHAGVFTREQAKINWPLGRMPVANVTCTTGYLSGQIFKGDYEKVATLLAANQPFLNVFALDSPGGDVDEALKIGRLLRRDLIETWAPIPFPIGGALVVPGVVAGDEKLVSLCSGPGCNCASACALIWFGGVARVGTVGLHRPSTGDPVFRQLSPSSASSGYRREVEDIVGYLDEMEVPKSIVESMVNTSSDDLRWVGAVNEGLDRPYSIAEWEDATCGRQRVDNAFERVSCVSRLLSVHRDLNVTLDVAWRYFMLGAMIFFSIWLIIRLLKMSRAPVTAKAAQGSYRPDLAKGIAPLARPPAPIMKPRAIRRRQLILTVPCVLGVGVFAIYHALGPAANDYQAIADFLSHPTPSLFGALLPTVAFAPFAYWVAGRILRRRLKACEHCARLIKSRAAICRYCGHGVAPAGQAEAPLGSSAASAQRQEPDPSRLELYKAADGSRARRKSWRAAPGTCTSRRSYRSAP